jgi:YbbR domain-containing protein
MRSFRAVLSNFTTLGFALILAIIIWATAVRANDPEKTQILEISVETVGASADATLVTRPPDSVFITIEGPTSAVDETRPADYVGVIDLSGVPYGENEVVIDVRGGHDQVNVLSQSPSTAMIRLEQIVTRDIPVVLQVRGEVARGHRVGEARVEPDTIQVTGPAPRVDQLSESRVTIFVDNAREDISELRRPIFYDIEGNVASVVGLTVNPSDVEVIIPIIELAGFAEKPVTVDLIGEPAQGFRLLNMIVEPSSVQVTGSPDILQDLRVQTEVVDISGLTESETRQVTLDLPDGVTPVDLQPIVVTVEIGPILTSDVVQRPVEVRALSEGLEATVNPEEVRVFLFGPLPVLDSLEEEDVRVTIDALGLVTGTHVLEPIVTISAAEVEHRSTQPAAVTIIITRAITATDSTTETLMTDSLNIVSADNSNNPSEITSNFFSFGELFKPIFFNPKTRQHPQRAFDL